MRIVFLSFWYSENMGYISNLLPKAFAALGHEVHVVTSTAQFYFDSPTYKQTYEPFIGPPIVESTTKLIDGYTLHRLPLIYWRHRIGMRGLWKKLYLLKPEIVQTVDVIHLSTYQAAISAAFLGFKLFTGCHMHASVFPPANNENKLSHIEKTKLWLSFMLPGRLVNQQSVKCYAIAPDTANIATNFFGISCKKVEICSLGVDTNLFQPIQDEQSSNERRKLRKSLGIGQEEIVCIYTGRFSEDKNPLCLAKAIDALISQGLPFHGLFIGAGPQEMSINNCKGCTTKPFVPVANLVPYYRLADIGVWPKQESTSMLDAAASGLPLVVSNQLSSTERIEGNGLMYEEDDPNSLADTLKKMIDSDYRQTLGKAGVAKMQENFSWIAIAKHRINDYQKAINSDK